MRFPNVLGSKVPGNTLSHLRHSLMTRFSLRAEGVVQVLRSVQACGVRDPHLFELLLRRAAADPLAG